MNPQQFVENSTTRYFGSFLLRRTRGISDLQEEDIDKYREQGDNELPLR